MKKCFLVVVLILLMFKNGYSQFFDNYGINIGAAYSNQFWHYKNISMDNSNQDYKLGLSVFLSTEKKLSEFFSIRSEIGYIQKGFKNNIELDFGDGTTAGVDKKNVIFHNLGLNIELKITPFKYRLNPYVTVGLRGDYMFLYKDIIGVEQSSGLKFNMYKSVIDEFNKFNLGGLVGIGINISDLTYLEIEYNPSITNSLNTPVVRIKDNCWGIRMGMNINKLLDK